MRATLALLAAGAAALAAGVSPAGATTECRGLQVCVPVAGPWVVVPTGRTVPRPRVEYQLTCPRGYIVGGLDAELTSRAIEIAFLGRLGSPVNPGVTTTRSAVFVATYVGSSRGVQTARPHIGCMPASGGGQRVPTAVSVVPPGQPTTRRVKNTRLRPRRTQSVVQGCARGERLVAASHAVGFYKRRPPSAALVASVGAVQTIRGGRAIVQVRSGAALRGVRAVVQVSAVCAGGR